MSTDYMLDEKKEREDLLAFRIVLMRLWTDHKNTQGRIKKEERKSNYNNNNDNNSSSSNNNSNNSNSNNNSNIKVEGKQKL